MNLVLRRPAGALRMTSARAVGVDSDWRLAWVIVCFAVASTGSAAEIVQPLRIARLNSAQSQVDEGATPQESNWVLLHQTGLRVVNIESGAEKDVLTVPRERRLVTSKADQFLTRDARYFAALSLGESIATIRRVADGGVLVELDSRELVDLPHWRADYALAADASYLLGVVRKSRSASSLVRIDFSPTPHITASRDLGPLAYAMHATPQPEGIVVVVPSDDTGRAPAGRWLQVFDHHLELQHKEKVLGPNTIAAAVGLPEPLIAIRSAAGDNGIRFRGEPQWALAELVRGSADSARSGRSQMRTRLVAKEWIMTQGAFTPDGKWLVTSRDEALPALDIRSTATGELHRKIHVAGGRHELPGHQVISRLAFSKSGRYLCASDHSNAYLLDFQKLLDNDASLSQR